MSDSSTRIAAVSKWLDESRRDADKTVEQLLWELNLWRRVTKVGEEAGEVQEALRGLLGENPRKGVTHTVDDLIGELLDTAGAALGSVEHLTGNQGLAMTLLSGHLAIVSQRAGLEP